MSRIDTLLKNAPKGIKGKIVDNHIILDIIDEEVHYWSPQVNFRVEPHEQKLNHSIISGLIGPRPEVWTMFMFIYFTIGAVGFFVSSYGVAKLTLGEYSNFILALPIAILLMLTAYRAGKYGEQLAKDQIEILKAFIREAITISE